MPSDLHPPSRATIALCLLPIAVIALGIAAWGVNIPYVDQFKFVAIVEKSRDGTLSLSDLLAQNNENRPLFPRLIWLALAAATRYDLRAELWANLALAVGTFAAFAAHALRTWRRAGASVPVGLLPLASFMVFNWSQWESWLNGFQSVFFLGSACAIAGFILLSEEQTWGRFVLAALAGVVGTFSTPNALLYWPIGLMLLWISAPLEHRLARLVLWAALGGTCLFIYMSGWHGPAGFGPAVLAADALPRAYWLTNFLGAPMMTIPHLAFPFGLLSYGLYGMVLVHALRTGHWRQLGGYFAIGAFVVGSGLLASMARLHLGVLQAVGSGYLAVSVWYWAALLVLLPCLPLPRLALRITCSLIAVCLLWLTVWGSSLARAYHLRLLPAYQAAASGAPISDESITLISRPEAYATTRDALRYLEQHRLSAYATRDR